MSGVDGRRARTRHYRDLSAWQKAMLLVKAVYDLSRHFPVDERFGLTSQIRRAAVPVPSNIAEGHGRLTDRGFHVFLGHARGSLFELETQTIVAVDLGYVKQASAQVVLKQASEVARLLNGLIRRLEDDEKA